MNNDKSIYKQFYYKLILATSLFVVTLSIVIYTYTKATIYEEIQSSLLNDAKLITHTQINSSTTVDNFILIKSSGIKVILVKINDLEKITYSRFQKKDDYFAQILYPVDIKENKFLKITKNINSSRKLLNKIFNSLILLTLFGLGLVIIYAITLSKNLLKPIILINDKLSKMDENYLTQINKNTLPLEFHALADSINSLTKKIETFVKFKKELFVGAAHELKTPLAVMKLKNEVTLMKDRDTEKYKETLNLSIKQINDMNKMISSILDIGRQEGAQFEKLQEINLVEFLQRKTNDYRMLSAQKNITITFYSNVNKYKILIQPTLIIQIIQNIVQNAIKFSPEDSSISIRLEKTKDKIKISIIDSGVGIDEKLDLFAPFKRVGNQSGAGLGLFLAKSASDALGANLSIINRVDDKQGCIASLELRVNPRCDLS
ncbi:MAG: HAMP domain-containing histidine kinase [Campylobacteraceae bacterium]|nr:HAMP domain-containing histidine kinase [Campylobacteraceae bacterium]